MSRLTVELQHDRSSDRTKNILTISGLPRTEPNKIFYEIIGPNQPPTKPSGNFAIAAVLPVAMAHGGSLHIVGEASSDFLSTIEEYMAAWCCWRPDLFHPVKLSAERENPPQLPNTGSAIMAFSGGLDSAFALHAHKHNLLARRSLNVEGAVLVEGFDLRLNDHKSSLRARTHVNAMLDSYGVRLSIVRTNWKKDFCVNWQMTHILGIAAILHQFHHSYDAGVFADDVTYNNQVTPWANNAITNQMLGSVGFPIHSTGAAHSRTEKAAVVAPNPAVLDHIRVCYAHEGIGENCGKCEKCIRTKMNFYAVGAHRVPALGAPLSIDEVREIIPRHAGYLYRYTDLLENGTWETSDPIRAEVAELVCRYSGTKPELNTAYSSKSKNIFKRMEKRVRSSLYAFRTLCGRTLNDLNLVRRE